jgi:hypothetical protein
MVSFINWTGVILGTIRATVGTAVVVGAAYVAYVCITNPQALRSWINVVTGG